MQKNLILGYGQTGKSFEIFLNQKKVIFDIFDENFKPGHKSRKSNAAFISNAFCDFSAAGVIFFSALSSILSVSLFQWFARGPKTPMNLILFSCICYQVWIFNFGSINSVLLANGLIFTVLFKLLWDSSCMPRKERE